MAGGLHKLSAAKVKAQLKSGSYEDGGGLQLIVDAAGSKSWAVRVTINGKRVMRRLGGFPMISLEEARTKATAIRKSTCSISSWRSVSRA
jgi:hypothetical protein